MSKEKKNGMRRVETRNKKNNNKGMSRRITKEDKLRHEKDEVEEKRDNR